MTHNSTEFTWSLLEQPIERAQELPLAASPDLSWLGAEDNELVELTPHATVDAGSWLDDLFSQSVDETAALDAAKALDHLAADDVPADDETAWGWTNCSAPWVIIGHPDDEREPPEETPRDTHGPAGTRPRPPSILSFMRPERGNRRQLTLSAMFQKLSTMPPDPRHSFQVQRMLTNGLRTTIPRAARGHWFPTRPMTALNIIIDQLVHAGILRPTSQRHGPAYRLFLIPKPDGSSRVLYDLCR